MVVAALIEVNKPLHARSCRAEGLDMSKSAYLFGEGSAALGAGPLLRFAED
ncbi:hypothetical protein D3C75_1031400 [compost metagenome]